MLRNAVTTAETELLHEKTLLILEKIGVDFEHAELLGLFASKGLRVSGNRVFFDRACVEAALASVPQSFAVTTPSASVTIGGGKRAVVSASGALVILKNGESSIPTREDFIAARKLDDTSPITNLACAPFINLGGLPKEREALIKTALTLQYSTKPVITYCSNQREAEETITLASRFYGMESGCFTLGIGNVISPLKYAEENVASILAYCKRGLPVIITCCSMPGLTSPITLGGTAAQNNAEILAGVIMTQLVNPGTPVVYGNCSFGTDMRYASPASGAVEAVSILRYAAAMARYYHMPMRVGGSFTDAKAVDWQAGAESALSLTASLDCGTDFLFHACGELDGLNAFSMEKFVLDEELITSYLSAQRGELTADSIDLDAMEEVGPGGNYLYEDQTVELCKTELYVPKLALRDSWDGWVMNGSPSLFSLASAAVTRRLEAYSPPRLTPAQEALLAAV